MKHDHLIVLGTQFEIWQRNNHEIALNTKPKAEVEEGALRMSLLFRSFAHLACKKAVNHKDDNGDEDVEEDQSGLHSRYLPSAERPVELWYSVNVLIGLTVIAVIRRRQRHRILVVVPRRQRPSSQPEQPLPTALSAVMYGRRNVFVSSAVSHISTIQRKMEGIKKDALRWECAACPPVWLT